MSKDNSKPVSAENTAARPQTATVTETKFTLEKLAENCLQLFNVDSCVFAGATAGLSGEFTVSEVKNIIASWLKKEVK